MDPGRTMMGIRPVLAFILLALSCTHTGAQPVRTFGLKLGLTSAGEKYDFRDLPDPVTVRRTGLTAGVFMEWFNHPVLTLVTQLEYVQKGMGIKAAVTTPDSPEPSGTTTLYGRLDYLSVPVLVKVRTNAGSVTPFALAGVRIDHLINYRTDRNAFDILFRDFKRYVPGGTIGAGLEIGSVSTPSLIAEIRYNLDFMDSYSTNLLEVSNHSIDLWMGVCF